MPCKARSFNSISGKQKDWSFPTVEKSYYTNIWKGWYHQAFRANPEIPFRSELVRPLQRKPLPVAIRPEGLDWTLVDEPEVSVAHIKFMFRPVWSLVDQRHHRLVVVLYRHQL